MPEHSTGPPLQLRARGPLACFTRPELKVERFSYPVITPSAARGILEAVMWKPAITWHVDRIRVLSPIEFIAFRRNEVKTKAVAPAMAIIEHGGPAPQLLADADRAQRNTVALRNVDYVIEAHFSLTQRASDQDNVHKFTDMFRRRVEKGQQFHAPYLGCREFVADVLPPNGAPSPIDDDCDLGIMLWDINFNDEHYTPIFFRAALHAGVMDVPPNKEAAAETLTHDRPYRHGGTP